MSETEQLFLSIAILDSILDHVSGKEKIDSNELSAALMDLGFDESILEAHLLKVIYEICGIIYKIDIEKVINGLNYGELEYVFNGKKDSSTRPQ